MADLQHASQGCWPLNLLIQVGLLFMVQLSSLVLWPWKPASGRFKLSAPSQSDKINVAQVSIHKFPLSLNRLQISNPASQRSAELQHCSGAAAQMR